MKKAIYKPTKQNTIILNEFDDYCEILLDGDYKTVPKNDIEFLSKFTASFQVSQTKQEPHFGTCIEQLPVCVDAVHTTAVIQATIHY